LRGEGEAGDRGEPSGDLYVFLHVEEHDFFARSNDDIICRVPISFVQAALGSTIEVPTLEEKEKLKIPKGTQTGKTFKLKGKGIPHVRGYGRGDQIIEVFVQTPTDISQKQEELLREFEKLNSPNN
jgi:molecular chaperone DnaJ